MRRLKRRKTAAQPTEGALQAKPTIVDQSASDEDILDEASSTLPSQECFWLRCDAMFDRHCAHAVCRSGQSV